jgi:hypothetical protein
MSKNKNRGRPRMYNQGRKKQTVAPQTTFTINGDYGRLSVRPFIEWFSLMAIAINDAAEFDKCEPSRALILDQSIICDQALKDVLSKSNPNAVETEHEEAAKALEQADELAAWIVSSPEHTEYMVAIAKMRINATTKTSALVPEVVTGFKMETTTEPGILLFRCDAQTDLGGTVTYVLEVSTDLGASWSIQATNTNSRKLKAIGLKNEVRYMFRMRAKTTTGEGLACAPIQWMGFGNMRG